MADVTLRDFADSDDPLSTEIAQARAPSAIGQVETIEGVVEVIRVDGTRVALGAGDPLFQGDALETGEGAAIGVVLADDSTFSMGAKGRIVLDEMVYDAGSGQGHASLEVVQGVFTMVSGRIAGTAPDEVTITTPVGTIGIRGTTIATNAAPPPAQTTISLLEDSNGQTGEISFTNAGGSLVINQAGGTLALTSFFQPPPPPVFLSPAQIQQQYGSALNALPASPTRERDDGRSDDSAADEAAAAQQGEGEAGEGEDEEAAAAEGEGAAAGEGEPVPEGEQLAEGEGPPEDAPERAFEEAIASGATREEAFAAAAAAASEEALAQGADPTQVAAAVDAARAAYEAAIAAGASPEEALAAAEAAAEAAAPGAFADDGGAGAPGNFPGAPGTFGSGPQGPGGFADSAGDPFSGGATGTLLSGDPFITGGNPLFGGDPFLGGGDRFLYGGFFDDPFGPDGFGGDPFGDSFLYGGDGLLNTGDSFVFQETFFFPPDDTPDDTTDPVGPITQVVFGERFVHTAASDTFNGNTENTEYVYDQAAAAFGGSDHINDAGGPNDRITFSSLDDVVLRMQEASGDPSRVEIAIDANAVTDNANTVTLGSTALFASPENVILMSKAIEDLQSSDAALTDLNVGGVVLFGATQVSGTEVGYILAGTSNSDTIDLGSATGNFVGAIIFGKGGDDVLTGFAAADTVIFGGAGNDTLVAGTGNDALSGGDGDDVFRVVNGGQEFINGGAGSDTVAALNATVTTLNLSDDALLSIESIDLTPGAAAGVALTVSATQVASVSAISGDGTNDQIILSGGVDLRGVTLGGIDTIRLDSDNDNTAGTTTLLANGTTNLANVDIVVGSNTLHTHIASDNGLNLSGATLFTNSSATNSVLLDASGDTAGAVLTASVGTDFTAGGGITEIRELEGGVGSGDDVVTSVDGLHFESVRLFGIASVNIDSDNAGVSTLFVNSQTQLGSAAINGGSDANDVVQLANGGTTVSFANNAFTDISQIVGGTGADSISGPTSGDVILIGGQGADSLSLGGSGSHTVRFDAANEFGDTITGFAAGSAADNIDFNVAVARGLSTGFEALAVLGTVGLNTALVNYTTDVANFTSAGDVATALNNLVGLTVANSLLFATGNGSDTQLWHWTDGTGGTANGSVEGGELSEVALLSGVNNDDLTAADFDGFS